MRCSGWVSMCFIFTSPDFTPLFSLNSSFSYTSLVSLLIINIIGMTVKESNISNLIFISNITICYGFLYQQIL